MSRTKYLAFALITILLPIAGAELGLRLFDWFRGASAEARTSWYWGYTQDRLLGYRALPNRDILLAGGTNRLDTNSDGFRDIEFGPHQLAGKRIVFCIGESSTWGTGSTSRDTTWPRQLSKMLSAIDSRFVVLNAGMPGYTMVENFQLVNLRLLKYKPEAILYMGFRNDVLFYATSLIDRVDLNFYPRRLAGIPATWTNQIWMRSALIGMLVSRLGGVVQLDPQGVSIPDPENHLTPRGIQTMRDHIALLQALTARNGVKLLWVDQPIDYSRTSDASVLEEGRQLVRQELKREAVSLLNAHDTYDHNRYPMFDDVHFTDAGNHYLADILARQLIGDLGIVSR